MNPQQALALGMVMGLFAGGWIAYVFAWGIGYGEGARDERGRWVKLSGGKREVLGSYLSGN